MGEIVKCPINGSEKIIICTEEQRENIGKMGCIVSNGCACEGSCCKESCILVGKY